MNIYNSWRGGAILLHTLVMSILLCFISISVTRWVLNRYTGVMRTYRSDIARARSSGYAMKIVSNNAGVPTNCGSAIDGVSCGNNGGVITIQYDEDQ